MADMSLVSGGFNFLSGYITQSANNSVANIQAGASNNIRLINNITAGVVSARNGEITKLQKWAQAVRNDRTYEAVTANQEALAVNFNRARDARTRQNFAVNIRQAEESGRQQASAAASGITGSVVDVIDMTSRLRNGIQNTARIEAEGQMVGDYNKQEFAQRQALLDQLDYTTIFENPELLDFGQNVAKTTSPISAGLANNGALKQLVQGAGSFFNFGQTDYGLGGLASSGSRSMGD